MGREIAGVAASRGHEIAWTLDSKENPAGSGLTEERLSGLDAVFEFTNAAAAVESLLVLGGRGARVVCGTTGWSKELPSVTKAFVRGGGALVHAANFSVGVRHFFELATRAARLYTPAGYAAYLVEEHHAGKRDAPSGTAKTAGLIFEMETGKALPITSIRSGTIPGTHRLVFESAEDEVEIIHRARSRAGFARGAVWSAERIAHRTGVYEFGDLLKETAEEA